VSEDDGSVRVARCFQWPCDKKSMYTINIIDKVMMMMMMLLLLFVLTCWSID
jgi:hypothetical protein